MPPYIPHLTLCAAALLFSATPAAAQQAGSEAEKQSMSANAPAKTDKENVKNASSPEDPNEIVCKKFPPPVGTRVKGRKICKSKAQWADDEREIQQDLDRRQTRMGHQSG
ncbi:hypothetical protein LPB140_04530 [Sphingorhabdus lutea]|uniref:Uncharacterized protein n=1 Tax=Sphingorhabdus lutea TaxID=1913578 RepID=A0A1L3JAW2_9SPHN|nr:hypothetical protein [Sphingorhabdus lutea]APG62193.1 hypothetical protein LPB140_04530 [Sphingorhabdus lutea]